MVAAHDEGTDPGFVESLQLSGEKERRLHRRLVTVIEVAGDHQRVDPFVEAQVDRPLERLASRSAYEFRQVAVTERERTQR